MCSNSKNALLTETTWRTTALRDVVCICLRRDHESCSTNPLFQCYQTDVLDLKNISIKYLTPSLFKVLFDCSKDSWNWSENVLWSISFHEMKESHQKWSSCFPVFIAWTRIVFLLKSVLSAPLVYGVGSETVTTVCCVVWFWLGFEP